MDVLVLAGFSSLVVGSVLGLLGGGGGILAVPLLVYLVGVSPRPAIAVSLFFVGATSAVGAALHARAGRVRWKLGGIFGAASMLAAFVAGRLAARVPEELLLGGLSAVMVATALAMFRGRVETDATSRPPAIGKVLAIGAVVGTVSGLVGAGGGFLIVPALTLFGGLAMREAIATSLFVIALQSFAGFAGHVTHVDLSWPLVATMTGSAVVGMSLGLAISRRVSVQSLKAAFAMLVLGAGLFVVARQAPSAWTTAVAGVSLVAALGLSASSRRRSGSSEISPTEKECTTSLHSTP